MELYEIISERRSVRKYDLSRAVPEEVLKRVLDAARLAPSAVNFQPWHFIIVKNPVVKEKLKDAYPRDWFWTAPLIVVGCVDTKASWKRKDGADFAEIDLTIAMDLLILAATGDGLGTCWVGAFDALKIKDIFKLPEHIKPVVMTPLGYPADKAAFKNRKKMEEIIHTDKF